MAKPELTNTRDLSASKKQRELGNRLYSTDMDNLLYTYRNNQIVLCGVIDYKKSHPYTTIDLKQSSMQALRLAADQLQVPFLTVITYQEHPVPMWYVIPSNQIAKDKFVEWNLSMEGNWMSDLQYSMFNHSLRDIEYNMNEIGQLSSKIKEYMLPDIVGA